MLTTTLPISEHNHWDIGTWPAPGACFLRHTLRRQETAKCPRASPSEHPQHGSLSIISHPLPAALCTIILCIHHPCTAAAPTFGELMPALPSHFVVCEKSRALRKCQRSNRTPHPSRCVLPAVRWLRLYRERCAAAAHSTPMCPAPRPVLVLLTQAHLVEVWPLRHPSSLVRPRNSSWWL